ncbi:CRISPR-associated endonuclease Cas3'' [Sphingomonas sp.]|uniref:CRISPR-associated endonuclease Cas3'' n=1 Tax=Sphingomonas sp. TaxID=28214 RepID=UPI002B655680|nr:CRISPR-associated endonuclease Cas3'' [Sphingomonas sp.]HWK36950.1 CRISPR-associated endonuclease Cas3'' [Sphingomonas sp.]
MEIFAHSVDGKSEQDWEPLSHHLSATGTHAARLAEPFGCSTIALAMGLLHDIGKCAPAYQLYIRKPRDAGGPKGPDHSTAGAKAAVTVYGKRLGRLMAFGIAGHHAGLMDGTGGESGNLDARLAKTVDGCDGWGEHVAGLPTPQELTEATAAPRPNAIDPAFSASFLVRMAFSCLVDADCQETEAFYAGSRGEAPPARGGVLEPRHHEIVRAHMARHRRDDTPVNRLRSAVLDHATAKAVLPPGLFTLTVPTGGGKTLTSLSFAMDHALAHDLRRIVYVIPFTSIIEQTAQVFREQVGLGDAVLEHHSSFDWDRHAPASGNDREDEGPSGLAKLRRDAENWDAPIVVTTAVQFFESLFAARTGKARKLHNLAKSVIILDEAQSIPIHLLRPCMAAIDELARNYGATVILCTATQPALRTQDEALPRTIKGAAEGLDIPEERELAPDPRGLYRQLRRVKIEWLRDPVPDAAIAARFAEQPQMLCIVNSRAHARDLFDAIRDQPGAVHLTTLMCARHRRSVLARARADLDAGRPVRLVATSLIEAGVDISFPEVWRAATGLSSIAQAAGRCNRSGELGDLGAALGRAVVFEPAAVDGRKPIPDMILPFYQAAKNVLRGGGEDVLALDAVREYYRWLYWAADYAALDKATLPGGVPFPIMPAIRNTARGLGFPFARIATAFRMIDETMDPVIVPWDAEATNAIAAIGSADLPAGALRRLQRKLQQYVVPIPAKARAAMLGTGAAQAIRSDHYGDRFVVLESRSLYDSAVGLRLDDPTWRSAESNVM